MLLLFRLVYTQHCSVLEGLQFVIAAVFITCLISANITAVKLVSIFGLIRPAGVIVFPITYIMGDVLTEVYGFHHARRAIWLGFFCTHSGK